MAFKSPPPLKAGLFGARGIDAQPAGTINKPPPKPKGPPAGTRCIRKPRAASALAGRSP
jgi:hypothetical protein